MAELELKEDRRGVTWAVQHSIAEVLRADDWLRARRAEIVEQNSGELANLIRRTEGSIYGPVIVVGVDEISENYPAEEVTVQISITENVVLNRMKLPFAAALEVAEVVRELVNGEEWRCQGIRLETPGEALLTATVNFKGLVERVY